MSPLVRNHLPTPRSTNSRCISCCWRTIRIIQCCSPGHLRSSSLIHRPTLCCRCRRCCWSHCFMNPRSPLVRTGLNCLTECTEQHSLPRRYVPFCSTLQRILARALGTPSCSDLLELCKLRFKHGPVHAATTSDQRLSRDCHACDCNRPTLPATSVFVH